MTPSFYRGAVAGSPVDLTFVGFAADARAAVLRSLAFAGWQPNHAAAQPAAALRLTLTLADAPPQQTPFADPQAGFQREIAPGLFFEFDLAARQAVFTQLPQADPTFSAPRVRAEILHLLGLCTPALALHAACVATDAAQTAAWIFCGPSGAGKTTISTRLLQALPLIDQEIVLLDLAVSPPRLLNTPEPVPAPPAIAGLFQLRQAPRCAIAPLPVSEFIAKNMTRPFDLHLPAFLEFRLDKLTRLTDSLRPRTLAFNLQAAEVLSVLKHGREA